MTLADPTRPRLAEENMRIERYVDVSACIGESRDGAIYSFDIFDKRTNRRIDGGVGFAGELDMEDAIAVARRRVLGQRPRRGRHESCVAAEAWAQRHWGPRPP